MGRGVVDAADVVAVDDEAAAALKVEIVSPWKGGKPCISAGDAAAA
jgi:hypothetical protein